MSGMPIWRFANALTVGRLKDASRATSAVPRIGPVFRMESPLSSRRGSVENVGDGEAEDVLSVGELRDGDRAGAAVDLPRAVLREGVPPRRLVVAVLDPPGEGVGDEILARPRALGGRAPGTGPRAPAGLEPLPPYGGRKPGGGSHGG